MFGEAHRYIYQAREVLPTAYPVWQRSLAAPAVMSLRDLSTSAIVSYYVVYQTRLIPGEDTVMQAIPNLANEGSSYRSPRR